MNDYKRQYREVDAETKTKISLSSRNRPKSEQHKQPRQTLFHALNKGLIQILFGDRTSAADQIPCIHIGKKTVVFVKV